MQNSYSMQQMFCCEGVFSQEVFWGFSWQEDNSSEVEPKTDDFTVLVLVLCVKNIQFSVHGYFSVLSSHLDIMD